MVLFYVRYNVRFYAVFAETSSDFIFRIMQQTNEEFFMFGTLERVRFKGKLMKTFW